MGDAFYSLDGDRLVPSELTRGPWDPGAQHAGPPSALLARALERCEPREGLQVGRITVEILGPVPLEPLTVSARVVRPGRSVELLEASLEGPDGEVMRASSWRVARAELGEAGASLGASAPQAPPGPEQATAKPFFFSVETVGYHTAMDYLFVHGGFLEPGPATVWMRMQVPLVAGEEPTPLQRVMVAADSGNGVSAVLDWRRFLFINTDLSVHLMRLPVGEWVCLDSETVFGDTGMSDTVLWDQDGRLGRAAQTLLVRER